MGPDLASQFTSFLAPLLPYLLKAGEKAAEEVGRKLVGEAWEGFQALWGKLRPKVEARPAALDAVQEVAAHPQDEDAQAALRLQLRRLLSEDPALADEVARWLATDRPPASVVVASGDRSVAIGGNASGATIITGDRNRLEE